MPKLHETAIQEVLKHRSYFFDADAYLEFLTWQPPLDEWSIRHHILPKEDFPQFQDCEWNIIELTSKDHAEAHKIIRGPGSITYVRWRPEVAARLSQMSDRYDYTVSALVRYCVDHGLDALEHALAQEVQREAKMAE